MPSFIKKMYTIVMGEQIERTRAIRGQGSFRLETNFIHHQVDIDQWEAISDEIQEFKEQRNFEKDTFPLTSMVTLPKIDEKILETF